jgi:hypothetical protein
MCALASGFSTTTNAVFARPLASAHRALGVDERTTFAFPAHYGLSN